MPKDQKRMTAMWIREGRLAKGLTQKELSEKSNISIRSIQRIENGEIMPRSYTLKTLAEILNLPYEDFLKNARQQNFIIPEDDEIQTSRWLKTLNKAQRLILSIGLILLYIVLSFAFVSQSASFPETQFELFLLLGLVVFLSTLTLFLLWRQR